MRRLRVVRAGPRAMRRPSAMAVLALCAIACTALGIGSSPSLGATPIQHTHRHTKTHAHKHELRRPGAVGGLRVLTQTTGQVSVGWRRARRGSIPLDGYRVTRDGLVLGQTRGLSYAVRVGPGTHRITVTAVDLDGHLGPVSSPLTVTVPGSPGSGETAPGAPGARGVSTPRATPTSSIPSIPPFTSSPPSTPGGLRVQTVGEESAVVEWEASTSGEAVGYRVFRDGATVGQTQGLSMTLEHLAPGTAYTITVAAVDVLGATSAPSAPLQLETATPTPPSTPSGLQASEVGDESAVVQWGASTAVSGEVVGYRVFRDGASLGQTSGLAMTLEHLAPETVYTITVVAVDSQGTTSEPSAPLEVETQPPPQTHGTVQAALLDSTDVSFDDLQAHYQQIGVLYPTYFECGEKGAVSGEDNPLVTGWAQERGVAVMPRLNCQNPLDEEQVLNYPSTYGHAMIESLASLCETHHYQGIQIDFEGAFESVSKGAPPPEREEFTAFIKALAEELHEQGEKLSTIVTAKTENVMSGRAAMYNDAALAEVSDYVFVLDWGIHWTTSKPGGIDELPWFKKVAEYAAGVSPANRSKFVLGMPMYGIDWAGEGGPSNPGATLEYGEIVALENEFHAIPEWDEEAADPHYSYEEDGVKHSVWYTDKQSIEPRVALAQSLGLGVGLWHLGNEDQTIWEIPGLGG
jgi:spore germination protein YaaH